MLSVLYIHTHTHTHTYIYIERERVGTTGHFPVFLTPESFFA